MLTLDSIGVVPIYKVFGRRRRAGLTGRPAGPMEKEKRKRKRPPNPPLHRSADARRRYPLNGGGAWKNPRRHDLLGFTVCADALVHSGPKQKTTFLLTI
jgi:hypothetical protein